MTPARLATAFALVSLAALGGCSSTKTAGTAATPQACFNVASVSNYAAVNGKTVNLRVGVSDYYQVTMLGVCPDINWTEKVGFESTTGASQVCDGLDLTIHVPTPTGPQECAADTIRKLTPEEVAALPPKQKP